MYIHDIAAPEPSQIIMTNRDAEAADFAARGVLAAENGEFKNAADLFKASSNVKPLADTYEMLAQCMLELGRPEDALPACRKALLQNPMVSPSLFMTFPQL